MARGTFSAGAAAAGRSESANRNEEDEDDGTDDTADTAAADDTEDAPPADKCRGKVSACGGGMVDVARTSLCEANRRNCVRCVSH